MKNLSFVFLIMLVFLSCADEVRFNMPSFQAQKEGLVFWKANFLAGDIDNGGFLLEGRNSGERLQLITNNDARGTFQLGVDFTNIAIYEDANGVIYSTKNAPDPNISIYPTAGEIIIENIDNDNPKNVFGTFWFYAFTEDGTKAINFNEGVFYSIPLVGGLEEIQ